MKDPYAEFADPETAQPAVTGQADPYAEIATPATRKAKTKAPNGRMVEFDVPLDADDETVRKLAAQKIGDKRYLRAIINDDGTKIAPTAEPETVARQLGVGARNVIEGVAGIPDIVLTPLNAITNLATGLHLSLSPFEDFGRNAADAIGLPRDQNPGILSAMEKGAASSLGFAGAARGLARGGSYLLGQLAEAPIAQTLSGAAAGGTAEVARQSGAGPTGQVLAGLAGGVIAPLGASGASQVGRSVASLVTNEGATNSAARTLQSLASNPASAASRIRYAPQPVSNARPTLGEVAGDAGLAGAQRGLVNTNLTAAAQIGERFQTNAIARTKAADEALGPGSPQRLQDVGVNRLDAAREATRRQRAQAQVNVDERLAATAADANTAAENARTTLGEIAGRVGPTTDRAATGSTAREAFGNAFEQARTRTREAYRAPELEARSPVEVPREFFKSVERSADDFYGDGGGLMPPEMMAILNDAAEPGATTRTLANIDRRLADFAGAARIAGRRSEAAFADRIRNSLAEQTNVLATPEYRGALSNARALRAEQGRTFETGDAAGAFGVDRYGNPTVQSTELPTKLVRPGAPGGDTADGLIAAIGPEASERIAREEIRRLVDQASTPAQATALSRRYQETLARFPTLRADVDRWASATTNADQAAAAARISPKPTPEETASLSAISPDQTALAGTPLERIADPSIEPSSYITQLLRRSDGGRELRRLANQVSNDPSAMDGARRSLADFIKTSGEGPNFTASGDNVPSANPTRRAIQTVLKRAGPIINDQQRIVLQRLSKELDGVNFANTAGKPAGSETAINKTFTGIVGKQILGVAGQGTQLLSHALSLLGNGKQVQKLITEAVLDPKFAAELLTKATPNRIEALRARLQSSSTGAASGLYNSDPES